jgi:hypothetical protein
VLRNIMIMIFVTVAEDGMCPGLSTPPDGLENPFELTRRSLKTAGRLIAFASPAVVSQDGAVP